jgi:hypothetical protein
MLIGEDERRNVDNFCAAKNANLPNYQGLCAIHGWQEFSTDTRKCPICRKVIGRPYKNEPRSIARRAGETTYNDVCEIHGPVKFGVQSGRCMKCCTVAGVPRAPAKNYDAD